MNLEQRIAAFTQLGTKITELREHDFMALVSKIANENPWFTEANVRVALKGIIKLLNPASLSSWASAYHFGETKSVGVAMAGNIPLVGFHDFLCVLIAGHRIHIKMSSQDSILLQFIIDELIKIQPGFSERIVIADKLKNLDAVIATGSDNTARYFEYYFRNIPHIIRKNRSSCAVIMGEEPPEELKKLSLDVFTYFGLGCRNVAKVFVPEGYHVTLLLDAWADLKEIIHHHKYANNYDYQKSILLVNQVPFYDNGFVLLTANSQLVSPISVLYYEEYNDLQDLKSKIKSVETKTQCIVSANAWFQGSECFGEAQFPSLKDYADHIDTMSFLEFRVNA